jgi:hypothetical protein
MRRLVAAVALAVVAGCGPSDNNRNGTDAGPAPQKNAKGPPPMKGPGEGAPPAQKK